MACRPSGKNRKSVSDTQWVPAVHVSGSGAAPADRNDTNGYATYCSNRVVMTCETA